MTLLFIYGEVACGKLTVARHVARATGLPLFHNHLVVDAVGAVFPFGNPNFVQLRERFWLDTFTAAAADGRSMIFTFAPEPTVDVGFPERTRAVVEAAGGRVIFVALTVQADEQARRVSLASRAEFGKLRSPELLEQLKSAFVGSMASMPPASITIDTTNVPPEEAATRIVEACQA